MLQENELHLLIIFVSKLWKIRDFNLCILITQVFTELWSYFQGFWLEIEKYFIIFLSATIIYLDYLENEV